MEWKPRGGALHCRGMSVALIIADADHGPCPATDPARQASAPPAESPRSLLLLNRFGASTSVFRSKSATKAGTQGTLGGLVAVARRFPQVLRSALERLVPCSNDPVCADHEPAASADDRALHGSACHGCVLIAETSCEARNLFLDRALLVGTMANNDAAFFRLNQSPYARRRLQATTPGLPACARFS